MCNCVGCENRGENDDTQSGSTVADDDEEEDVIDADNVDPNVDADFDAYIDCDDGNGNGFLIA